MYNEGASELIEVLRKIAEVESRFYSINWDNWDKNVVDTDLEKKVNTTISTIEHDLEDINLDLNGEYTKETFNLCEALIEAYIAKGLLERKKEIENFLLTT